MDALIRGKFVLTQQEQYGVDGIIPDGAVYVSGRDIVEVGRYRDLKAVYPTATVIGSPRFWVMPGLVSAHQHGRGLTGFQLGGLDEVFEISRLVAAPQPRVDTYLDTLYACVRMIEAGITTCIHYNTTRAARYYEADVRERMRAYEEAGIRVSFGLDIRNRNTLVYGDDEFLQGLPGSLRERAATRGVQSRTIEPDDYFRFVDQLASGMDDAGRMKLFLTPNGPQWATEDVLRGIKNKADERDLGIQIHVLETRYQRSYFARVYEKTAVAWLNDLGFLSPRVSLAHGVWLSQADMAIVAGRGAAVVHNPSSNLRLRSGIAPLPLMHDAGIKLALGLDGSTLNDDCDLFQEMRLAANLQRVPGLSHRLVPIEEIFRMATVNGSEVLGWGTVAGTLEPGKRADLILLDMRAASYPYLAPENNPIHTLIYRGKASAVDTVMVDGELLYQGKKHLRLPAQSIVERLTRGLTMPAEPPDALNAELLPHVVRYYEAWDEDSVVPFHRVNSVG